MPLASGVAWSQGIDGPPDTLSASAEPTTPAGGSAESTSEGGLATDIKLYYTAPLRWSASDWAWFGGALASIAVSHHYDSEVRTHFVNMQNPQTSNNSYDLQDAIPTLVVLGGTWLYAGWSRDSDGWRETWAMLEAAGLSGVTAEVFKYAAGRERPDETSDPNLWRHGGSSFPSLHATVAFAVGTVLAESGNDDYRWVRRFLGYGVGIGTAYLRLKHNQHWLSDTVAGADLGISSGFFAMKRRGTIGGSNSQLSVTPLPHGAMLTYTVSPW